MAAIKLTYVFDAYCGWCYAFGPAVHLFAQANAAAIDLEVVSGGLFRDDRALPLRNFPQIAAVNARITELTGATFGQRYQKILAAGDTVMDSMDAAVGLAALRSFAPERALELTAAMQHSWYHNGESLSEPATYRAIAAKHSLDPDAVERAFRDPTARAAARDDIRRAAELGINSYPTLLAHTATGAISLGGPTSTGEQLTMALRSIPTHIS